MDDKHIVSNKCRDSQGKCAPETEITEETYETEGSATRVTGKR